MKYVLGIRTINTAVTIHSIYDVLTVTASRREGATAMNGGTGR